MNNEKTTDYLMYALTFITVLVTFGLLAALGVNTIISLIAAIILGVLLYKIANQKPAKKSSAKLKRVSPEKEAFYKSKGLSKDDIKFFRETMQKAKEQILSIENNMNAATKLQAIEKRNDTVRISKALFKSIIQEPQKLHQVDQFLYVHLPALDDLTKKYIQIKKHRAKSKATFDILAKSADAIDEMCGQIARDYIKFKSSEIEEMDMNVELAKQALEKDNGNTTVSIEQEEI